MTVIANALYAEIDRLRARVGEQQTEIERLCELLWGSRCVFCGEVVGKEKKNQDIADEVLRNHVEAHPKHPLSVARARIKELEHSKAILQNLLYREREEKRAIEDAMTDLQAAYNRLQKTQGHTLHDWATLNDQTMSLRARGKELEDERDADRRREYGYSQQTVDALTADRDEWKRIALEGWWYE